MHVTANGISFDDVLTMASSLTSDIIRRQINDPVSKSGSCLLDDARRQYSALESLLLWSSKNLAARADTGGKLAADYLASCRAGQTEIGSYIIKVYAPIVVPNASDEHRVFGREATMSAMANVDFLADEEYSPEHPLPAEFDWHVCEAVMRLRSSEALWGEESELSVRYLKNIFATGDAVPVAETETVPLKNMFFERATSLYETLRKGDLFETTTFTGTITDLHKDPPRSKKQDHRITILAKFDQGGPERNVMMRLVPYDYKRATVWHDKDTRVRVHAKIDKRWRVWTTAEYSSIVGLQPEAPEEDSQLF